MADGLCTARLLNMTSRRSRLKPGNPKVAVAYIRVSTDEQHLGPDAQRAEIERWASQEGVTIVSWHEDNLSGATKMEQRPGLLAALAAIREFKAGVFVAAKRDRLARETLIAILLQEEVERLGAKVVTVSEQFLDLATGEGKMMATILDAFAEFERFKIASRTKAALRVKKTKGELTGSAPFGFSAGSDGKLQRDEREQAVIHRVRQLSTQGLSRRAIVRELADEGMTSRSGKPLNVTQVHRILSNHGPTRIPQFGKAAPSRAASSPGSPATT